MGLLPDDWVGFSWLAPWQSILAASAASYHRSWTFDGARPLLLPHVNGRIEALFFVATATPPVNPANGRERLGDAKAPASSVRWLVGQSRAEPHQQVRE